MKSPHQPASWARARELFLDLSELEGAERSKAIQSVREENFELAAWVERLLERDTEPDPLADSIETRR